MPMPDQFPCLGLSILGMCSYNPAQPSPVYFSLGNAIAALGFTLAVQQFLKPIYLFRLRAYGLRLRYVLVVIFIGFFCAVVATVLPNLPISHSSFFEYPIVWELIGGLLISAAYGVIAFISLIPARIYDFNLIPFVRAASLLLSAAEDADRVSFAEDLLSGIRNIERLITYAYAWQRAENYAVALEFERLRGIGAPLQIQGRPPPVSAFYEFAHRKELERARFAGTFLRIISDPQFCSVLVRKCAWLTAPILEQISEKGIHTNQAEAFVQEIARQAILNDDSLMAKEVSYEGFRAVPVLSNSLFGNWFMLTQYNPLEKMNFGSSKELSDGYVSRLSGASRMMLRTAIRNDDYWPQRYMFSVERAYENLSQYLSSGASGASKECRVTA